MFVNVHNLRKKIWKTFPDMKGLHQAGKKTSASLIYLNFFWSKQRGYLFDCISEGCHVAIFTLFTPQDILCPVAMKNQHCCEVIAY